MTSTLAKGTLVIPGTGDVNLDPDYIPALATNGYGHAWEGLEGYSSPVPPVRHRRPRGMRDGDDITSMMAAVNAADAIADLVVTVHWVPSSTPSPAPMTSSGPEP